MQEQFACQEIGLQISLWKRAPEGGEAWGREHEATKDWVLGTGDRDRRACCSTQGGSLDRGPL